MEPFVCKNKSPLTGVIIILSAIIMLIDWWLEKETSTKAQWTVFVVAAIAIIYIQFVACADIIEYENGEYYPAEKGEHPVPSLQDRQSEELIDFNIAAHEAAWQEAGLHLVNTNGDIVSEDSVYKTKKRTVYIMQPVHVTEEEFDKKITNNQIDMEAKDNNKELPKALEDTSIVIGFSLHNINKKYRSMYSDICQFAIEGGKKTEEEITAKVKLYGYPIAVDKPKSYALAYEIACEPKIRIPETGYFGIK